jgi:CubicO group peptidase (beta-lactamase class C family)
MVLLRLISSLGLLGYQALPERGLHPPDAVDRLVEDEMRKRRIPALSLAIVRDGRITKLKGYGWLDSVRAIPATPATVYQIASVTKIFTGAAVMALVQNGQLALSDPVTRFVDGLPPSWRSITVGHCLTHTTGLSDVALDSAAGMFAGANVDQAIASAAARPPILEPGDTLMYQAVGYLLLGKVVERLTGKPVSDYLRDRFFRPLRMRSTRYARPGSALALRTKVFREVRGGGPAGAPRELEAVPFPVQSYDHMVRGLFSTVEDLARWDLALTAGRVLSPATLDAMWTPARLNDGRKGSVFGDSTIGYGGGWMLYDGPAGRAVGHVGGNMAQFLRFVDRPLTVIVLTNSMTAGAQSLAEAIAGVAVDTSRLGVISFPTSAGAAAQREFTTGVLYLHSFEYQAAAARFREAQRLEPGFAMAYWGEAMTHNHPLWLSQDREAALAVLERLASTPEARRAKAPTDRERRYLDAVEALFGPESKGKRDSAYAEAMRSLAAAYPHDLEAQAFSALAMMGMSAADRDVATYLRAGAMAEGVLRTLPQHPGAAHYTIHAYDDPSNAPRGLAAAGAYSSIAPSAGHAQHMTSHIFVAMGMWDDVVAANERALRASGHLVGHYAYWLQYAFLQQGKRGEARRALTAMVAEVGKDPSPGKRLHLAYMRAAYLVEARTLDEPAAIATVDTVGLGLSSSFVEFADGLIAAFRRDSVTAARVIELMASRNGGARASLSARRSQELGTAIILEHVLRAELLESIGRRGGAIEITREAVRIEDTLAYESGPPASIKPPGELLGELLLRDGEVDEAVRQFDRALKRTPGRARSLLGLAQAEAARANWPAAERAYAKLRANWSQADSTAELRGLPRQTRPRRDRR